MKNLCSFVIVFVGLVRSCNGKSERVVIGEPVLQCGENGSINEIKTDFTRIRLPANTHALYSVNTERTTNCSNNHQRCTLMTWKIIRDFEMYLNVHYNFTGANGTIQFSNDKLIPGFNYLLHVMLKDAGGKIGEKDFNITFFDEINRSKKIDTLGHLDLKIGTNRIYSTLPLVVNAYATICGDFCYYYFIWTISRNEQEIKLPERSSELFIPGVSMLIGDEERCIIRCQVMKAGGGNSIVEGSIDVHIVDPPDSEIQVFLPFQYTTVNKGAPISIVPYIYSSRNLEYKTEWVCWLEDILLYGCQGQINTEFYMDTGFDKEGHYSITLIVSSGNTEKSAICHILVVPDMPSIELDVPYPIRPENGIEISAKISELRTFCTVEWLGDGNSLNLKDIPGLTETFYNISSKDKEFLGELVELGRITVTKTFKLKLPPPSKAWAGLRSKICYHIRLSVTCPSMEEINDMSTIKEHPEDFRTVTAQTKLLIPPSPQVDSLEIEAGGNEAFLSPYSFIVSNSVQSNSPMLYRYGFTLEGVHVVFYSGIDEFSAKTVLPYGGEHGIETYVEICNFEGRCGRRFGPVAKTVISQGLNESAILKTLKQKLAEENFYKVFSYAFTVLHSSRLLNQSAEYKDNISLEILSKIKELGGRKDGRWTTEKLIKDYVTFEEHLDISDDLSMEILELTQDHLINTRNKRDILSDSGNLDKLEDIREYLKIADYLILNSDDNKDLARGKDHILEKLDEWMTIACKLLFVGQRIHELELKTMALAIEKFPRQNLKNTILTSPFEKSTFFKINTNLTTQRNYCLGHVMFKNLLGKEETYGVNIYSAENSPVDKNSYENVIVYLPYREEFREPLCMVYREGKSTACSSSKQYTSFIECVCPTFGYYYFLDSVSDMNTVQAEKWVSMNVSDNFNSTSDVYDYETARRIGRKISYVIILSSLVGFLILCYIIRKLTIFPQQNITMDGFSDTYAYGHAMDEDF